VVRAFQPSYGGAGANAFVAKLDADGAELVYSSYMGGQGSNLADVGVAIAVDDAGYAYLAGRSETVPGATGGYAFPIVDAFQPEHAGGVADAFVTKLTPDGRLVFSSYLGGSQFENANGIAVSAAGDVYLTGTTWSQDFPVANAYQSNPGGGGSCDLGLCPDAFVTKIVAGGAQEEPALALDAARIRLRSGRPDVLSLHGRFAADPSLDPSVAAVTVEIASASGVLASFSLPPGSLVKKPSGAYVARDADAARSGGLALVKLAARRDGATGITLKGFADVAAAPAADMTITLRIADETYAARGTWRPIAAGWRLVPK
jgi:hypothetical protein